MDDLAEILANIARWRSDEYHDLGSESDGVWQALERMRRWQEAKSDG